MPLNERELEIKEITKIIDAFGPAILLTDLDYDNVSLHGDEIDQRGICRLDALTMRVI